MEALTASLENADLKPLEAAEEEFFSPGGSFQEAALRLLCSQFYEADKQWKTTEGSFTQLGPGSCSLSHLTDELAPCFSSHTAIAMPDNPPAERPWAQGEFVW